MNFVNLSFFFLISRANSGLPQPFSLVEMETSFILLGAVQWISVMS